MDIKDAIPINWSLMAHPMNWVILFLMVVIALFAFDIVIGRFGQSSTQGE